MNHITKLLYNTTWRYVLPLSLHYSPINQRTLVPTYLGKLQPDIPISLKFKKNSRRNESKEKKRFMTRYKKGGCLSRTRPVGGSRAQWKEQRCPMEETSCCFLHSVINTFKFEPNLTEECKNVYVLQFYIWYISNLKFRPEHKTQISNLVSPFKTGHY